MLLRSGPYAAAEQFPVLKLKSGLYYFFSKTNFRVRQTNETSLIPFSGALGRFQPKLKVDFLSCGAHSWPWNG
jgi:hypothetical protein